MDAQDPNLPDRDWYLNYATVDGLTREPPFPGFEAILNLSATQFNIYHPYCSEALSSTVLSYEGTDVFQLEEDAILLLGFCGEPAYNVFMGHHYSFYYHNGSFAKNPFTYEITSNGQWSTLEITNANGDLAVYHDQALAVPGIDKNSFGMFPNPAEEMVTIRSAAILGEISFYDLRGRLIYSQGDLNTNEISLDISDFDPGFYLTVAKTENGELITRKLYKE